MELGEKLKILEGIQEEEQLLYNKSAILNSLKNIADKSLAILQENIDKHQFTEIGQDVENPMDIYIIAQELNLT